MKKCGVKTKYNGKLDLEKKGGKRAWKRGAAVFLMAVLGAGALAGCGQSGQTIHMATKPMTEQYIMGSMMKTLIEQDTDLTVEVTEGVGGGTANIHPAMEEGEFDFYPEYTGRRDMTRWI